MIKTIAMYHVNAFTDKLFTGNPAAVCVLSRSLELDDQTLQAIAKIICQQPHL